MAGRVQHRHCHVAEFENVTVLDATESEIGFRALEEHVLRAGSLGERATGRDVVGMNVRVDRIEDTHACRPRCLQIRLNLTDRVDDGCGGLAATTEQVGRCNGIGMEELSEDHGPSPERRGRIVFGRTASA
jgi:hypothetical protein